jgi:hypothetical protein
LRPGGGHQDTAFFIKKDIRVAVSSCLDKVQPPGLREADIHVVEKRTSAWTPQRGCLFFKKSGLLRRGHRNADVFFYKKSGYPHPRCGHLLRRGLDTATRMSFFIKKRCGAEKPCILLFHKVNSLHYVMVKEIVEAIHISAWTEKNINYVQF